MADKTCTICGTPKQLTEFGRNRRTKDGRSSYCRVCGRAKALAWNRDNPRRRLEIAAKWKAQNPEKPAASRAKWRAANREKVAASCVLYRKANPEKTKAKAALNNACRSGKVTRQPCEKCGAEPALGHHDSYLPEHRLDVRWLCRKHHAAHHRAERAEAV